MLNARDHNEADNSTKTSTKMHRAKEDGETYTRRPKPLTGSSTKTLTGASGEGVAKLKKKALKAQEAKEDAARKASMVEAEIRRLEDYMGHTERDIGRAERRLEELARRVEGDREQDRRTQQRMGAFIMTIELTRLGAKAQREEAERVTREAAGQGLAVARARAMGQADSGRVK